MPDQLQCVVSERSSHYACLEMRNLHNSNGDHGARAGEDFRGKLCSALEGSPAISIRVSELTCVPVGTERNIILRLFQKNLRNDVLSLAVSIAALHHMYTPIE